MKITFVLPFTQIGGGIRVIFEYANRLQKRGHNVFIVYPLIPLHFGVKWHEWNRRLVWMWKFLNNLKRGNQVNWFNLEVDLIMAPTLSEKYIPDGDIVVATAWPTTYYVRNYSESKGKKVYFVQHYEIDSGPKDLVDRTYTFSFHQITIAKLTEQLLKEKFDRKVSAVIPNGVNFNTFHNDNKLFNDIPKILMYYSRGTRKGAAVGIRALEIVRQQFPKLEFIMYGVRKGKNIPNYVKFVKSPTDEQLRKFYSSCDIFVYPSEYEGFGLPPMEAMACKCAVVTTSVGAVLDYTLPGKTALVSPPRNSEALAQNVIRLLNNQGELKRISMAGYNYIKKFTWEKVTGELEKVFENLINSEEMGVKDMTRVKRE